jgi:hypothetical protein
MDLVERLASSKTKKEIVHGLGAGNMGISATWNNFAPPFGGGRDDGENLD